VESAQKADKLSYRPRADVVFKDRAVGKRAVRGEVRKQRFQIKFSEERLEKIGTLRSKND
jgi:hypothetical protein